MRAWAKDADSLVAVKSVAKSYFGAYPDISLVMYYYDVYASALIYAVVDIVGLIADIAYDIFEFFLVLLLDVYQTLIHVLIEGLMWIINNAGDTISAIWSLIGDAVGIVYQYFVNVGGCFSSMAGCDTTNEVYRCCDNVQLWSESQVSLRLLRALALASEASD